MQIDPDQVSPHHRDEQQTNKHTRLLIEREVDGHGDSDPNFKPWSWFKISPDSAWHLGRKALDTISWDNQTVTLIEPADASPRVI